MSSSIRRTRWGLPLLAKELLEQSARLRTYVIRVAYALLLFCGSYALFHSILDSAHGNVWSLLGKGKELYEGLLGLQFAGIYLFMPAITCGVITQEKERNSLTLLLLTRLDPWTIVLEKLLSRLVPMLCFVLLSLPLLAFAYSLGGITPAYFWGGVWMLGATALQAGTLAVFCSAWFRTTVGAFIGTYLIGLILIFGPGFLFAMIHIALYGTGHGPPLMNWPPVQVLQSWGVIDNSEQLLLPFLAPAQTFQVNVWGRPVEFRWIFVRSIPLLLWSWCFLNLARRSVVSRAFLSPVNPLLRLWQLVDGFFMRINQNRVTRGVVLVKDRGTLPDFDPVSWRETTKRSLGRTRYLARLFIIIEVGVLALLFSNAVVGDDVQLPLASLAFALVWIVIGLLVTVSAASLVSGERSHQTLDVLCVTPISSRDIIVQKFSSVRRLILVLSVPLFTVILFEVFWKAQFDGRGYVWGEQKLNVPLYFVSQTLTAILYPPALGWLSCWIGLSTRTQVRAIMSALIIVVGWCAAPLIFLVAPLASADPDFAKSPQSLISLLSPLTMLAMAENDVLHKLADLPWEAVALNSLLAGSVWLTFRLLCLSQAARLLGRSEGALGWTAVSEPPPVPARTVEDEPGRVAQGA